MNRKFTRKENLVLLAINVVGLILAYILLFITCSVEISGFISLGLCLLAMVLYERKLERKDKLKEYNAKHSDDNTNTNNDN